MRRHLIVGSIAAAIAVVMAIVLWPHGSKPTFHDGSPQAIPASQSGQPAQPAPSGSATATCARQFGVYVVTNAPLNNAGQAANDASLKFAHDAGFTTVISYDLQQASPEGVIDYLNVAKGLGLKVILNLQEWGKVDDPEVQATYDTYGKTPDEWAAALLDRFAGHPAVSAINITDELPEAPGNLANGKKELQHRAAIVRAHTNKPIMLTLVGWTANSAADRQQFLHALMPTGDELALDYYPLSAEHPGTMGNINLIAADLAKVNPGHGWFVAQDNNQEGGEAPTEAQMVDMATRALKGGAQNLMFYALFPNVDVNQLNAIKGAMKSLRAQFC